MTFPPVGVTAVIAGMSIFNRDAAVVESRLLRINGVASQLERDSGGAFGALGATFGSMASTLVTGGTLIGGALLLAGGAAVKFAADFQSSLALTGALTNASSDQISRLGDTITELSRHGVVSMDDLAKASTALAQSGVPIEDVMGGALKAVQDLTTASGGEIGLENAAKLTATAMQAFGISVDDVSKVTTAATVVAQNSALTFTDFKTAVATAGAPFASVGFSINDLAIATALLGRNALSGSVASTALRNIIQRLEKPSKDASAVMKEYGIHLFDAQGNAVTLRELIGQLSDAFGDQAIASGKITEQERDQALATLFLQRAGAAALILTREGVKGYDDLAKSFETLNASDIVDKLLKPLNAQLAIARNNVLALAITFGDQFLPPLQDATAAVVAFLQGIHTSDVAAFGQTLVGIGAAAIQFGVAFVKTFNDIIVAFGLTDAAGQLLKSTLVGIGIIIGTALVGAVASFIGTWGAFLLAIGTITVVAAAVDDAIAGVLTSFANWVGAFGPLGQAIANLSRTLATFFEGLGALFRGDTETAIHKFSLAFYEFATTLRVNGGQALQFLQDRLNDLGALWAPWAAQAGVAGDAVGKALSSVSGIIESLQFLLQGNLPAAGAAAQAAFGDLGRAVSGVGAIVGGALKSAFEWVVNTAWPAISADIVKLAPAFDTVKSALGDLGSAVGTGLQNGLKWLIEVAWPGMKSGAEEAGKFINDPLIPALAKLAANLASGFKTAVDWVITTGWPGLKQGAQDAADVLTGVLIPAIGNTALALQPKLESALNATGTAFSNMGSTASSVNLQPFLDSIGQIKDALAVFSGAQLGTLGTFISLFPTVFTAMKIPQDVTDSFKNLSDARDNIGKLLGVLGEGKAVIQPFLDLVGKIFTSMDGFRTTFGPIIAIIAGFYQAVVGLSQSFGLLSAVVSVIESPIKIVTLAFSGITAAFRIATELALGTAQAIGALFHALSDLPGAASAVGSVVGPVFSALGTVIRAALDGAGQAIAGFVSGVGPAFSAFGASIHQNLATFATDFYVFSNSLGTAVDKGLNAAINAVDAFITSIERTIGAGFSAVGTIANATWQAFPRIVAAGLTGAAEAVSGFFTILGHLPETLSTVVTAVGAGFSSLGTNATSAFYALGEAANVAFGALGTTVNNALSAMFDGIDAFLHAIEGVFAAGWNAMVTATASAWQAVVDTISTALAGAGDAATTGITIIGQIIEDAEVLIEANASEAWNQLVTIITTALASAIGGITAWAGNVLGALAGLAGDAAAAAASIGQAIIDGIIGGINAGIASVQRAASNMATSALNAAKSALGVSSPSKLMQEVGQDTGQGLVDGMEDMSGEVSNAGADAGYTLSQSLISTLDGMKAPVRASAASLVDQAVSAFNDLSTSAQEALDTMGSKMAAIGETVGRKINDAIREAAAQIEQVQMDAASRIQDLNDNLTQSRSDRGRRDALKKTQDAARDARKAKQDADDAALGHANDITDAEFKHKQDIAKAQAKSVQDLSQATTSAQKKQVSDRLADELAAADVSYQQELDRINRQFAADEANRAAKQQRQVDDAAFEAKLNQDTQALNDQLEDEALQRSIKRANDDADARIAAINKALEIKEQKIRADAEVEIKVLHDNIEKRLQALEIDFANKAAELLRKGGENMRPLVENIQQALSSNFDAMRQSALDFTNQVESAINALKDLERARHQAEFKAPNLPSPTDNMPDDADIGPEFTNVPLPEFGAGGMIPGPLGKPMLAIVHGGEFVAGLDSAAARLMRGMSGAQPQAGNNVYNYNVNATYADQQSEASVGWDMRALVAMARGA